jgi:parvulin-like peptidyl-prolyl cis-trans isomerase-like protein
VLETLAPPSDDATSPPPVGDAFPLSRDVHASPADVAPTFGAEFADELTALEVGRWSRPIHSKYGWHLVRVLERLEGGPARFEDMRGQVKLAHLLARKQSATAKFLRDAYERYQITIDGEPSSPDASTPRSSNAPRDGED